MFRDYGWVGKSRKTYFETGRDKRAKESDVWRIVHRLEFERSIEPSEVRMGQILRVLLRDKISDFTGIVTELVDNLVKLTEITGIHKGRFVEFYRSEAVGITEILSCPLFYDIRQEVLGEKANPAKQNIP